MLSPAPRAALPRQQRRAIERSVRKAARKRSHLASGAFAVGALLAAGSATAATFTVTNLTDADPGSLREAITQANTTPGADTINFQVGLTGTITLTSGELAINESLTVNGPGMAVITVSGNGSSTVFNIENAASPTPDTIDINNLTVTGGTGFAGGAIRDAGENLTLNQVTISGSTALGGGALYFDGTGGATLNVVASTITGNTASYVGAGVFALSASGAISISNTRISSNDSTYGGGGLAVAYCDGPISVTGSTIESNTAGVIGGGIFLYGAGAVTLSGTTISGNKAGSFGGGMAADLYDTQLGIANSVISGNTAGMTNGARGYGGGLFLGGCGCTPAQPPVEITDSIISGNVADPADAASTAGAESVDTGAGGGVYVSYATLNVIRTTISGNTAYVGGGIFQYYGSVSLENATLAQNHARSTVGAEDRGGAFYAVYGTTAIVHSTITGNTAASGTGGVAADDPTMTIGNSIIANNTGSATAPDIDFLGGSVTPNYTLIKTPGAAALTPGTGNILDGTDPNLGPLAVNGSSVVAGAPSTPLTPLTQMPGCTTPGPVNAGNPAFAPPPSTDARGLPRVSAGRTDMGAVELQASTVQFAAAAASVGETGGSITVTAVRTGAEGAVDIAYATANGTASGVPAGIATPDYTPQSGTLSWPSGDTSIRTFTVPITDDSVFEGNETFTATLSAPTCFAALGANAVQIITIADNETQPVVSIGNVSQPEGNSGSAVFPFAVTLSGPSVATVTVNFATGPGTATAGSDYTTNAGTVTFAPGEVARTADVVVAGDTTDEPNETFTVTLSAPANATLGAAVGTGTIQDDDVPPVVSIGTPAPLAEGNAGTANMTFTVTLSAASGQVVTVNYATANGTAAAGTDYSATSGMLTFAPGVITQTITVPILGDALDESNETFTVTLSGPANATLGPSVGTGTIQDDDGAPIVSIVTPAAQAEGNVGVSNMTFTVTLSVASGQAVTVNYATADGSATAGSDYTATAGTLTFAPGVITQTIAVPIVGDVLSEPNEAFTVTLSAPVNAILGPAVGTATIQDDDGAPVLSISTPAPLAEGNAGTTNMTFIVSLSVASGQIVTVNYATADGTATAGSDYTASSGTLTFAPGVVVQSISVPVFGDVLSEPDETFTVTLSGPANAILGTAVGTGTIQNDEAASADLSISEVATGAIWQDGQGMSYTITVANAGPGAATSVVVTDTLPASATFVSATPSQGTCSGTTTVTCSLGALPAGGNATIVLQVMARLLPAIIVNTATVSAAEADPNLANNSSTSTSYTAAIPTLGEWAKILLAFSCALLGFFRIRKS